MGAQVFRDFTKNYPIITRGKGVFLYDTAGREYLDAVGGISVVNIGHGVPEVVAAMQEQADKVAFVHGGSFANEAAWRSVKLATWAPKGMGHILLLSGGSEATETAMKLAHQYHLERGKEGNYRIVSRWISYHGNTIGALPCRGGPPGGGSSRRTSRTSQRFILPTATGAPTGRATPAAASPAPRSWSG